MLLGYYLHQNQKEIITYEIVLDFRFFIFYISFEWKISVVKIFTTKKFYYIG